MMVTGRGSSLPPPITPTLSGDSPSFSIRPLRHCCSSSIVGTTTSVRAPTASIAIMATTVLPAPVGSTTTPRPSVSSQRRTASR